ncbi:hypothetical protein XENOCAPTIV_019650 [Xenoophorus captivus]|uniref:Uncharacterized protein n=1 Tax=Xenoophorus captivus TaxID=1517983 RepID=A0ABV0QST9_9TELE
MTNTAGNTPADHWTMTSPQNQSWFAPLQPLSTSSVQSRKCLASLQSQLALRLPAASKNIRLPSDSGRAQQFEELDNHTVSEPDKPESSQYSFSLDGGGVSCWGQMGILPSTSHQAPLFKSAHLTFFFDDFFIV